MFEKAYEECRLCPRECGVNRKKGQTGFCQMDGTLRVARAALHMWEEPCISGKRGSGAVFFSGCNLRCVYCQNFDIAAGTRGKEISRERLSEIFLELQAQGAVNINLVTPDHFIPQIIEAIDMAKEKGFGLPFVYNCSGYEEINALKLLDGYIDIYLPDFKYMSTELAARYSHAPDYPEVAKRALEQMVKITGEPLFNKEGMMQRGVIVRHLLLPGHKKNAKAVLQYLWETYGDRVYISLMNQYTPMVQLTSHRGNQKELEEAVQQEPQLMRKVTAREYEQVVDYALQLGITNAFIQEGDVAKESFIPDFDTTGV